MPKQPYEGKYEKDADETVDAKTVRKFHSKADTDSSPFAIHHTIGMRKDQAASGTHNHRGVDSVALLSGVSITGARGGNSALASVIAALVQLGATDQTTP